MRAHVAAVMMAIGMLASATGAQETKVVTVGPEYAAGGAERFWLGDGYRGLWTTPVTVAVLDLKKEAGGLTPVRQVGKAPSVGLAMTGADGRSYTFRSLHKESDRMLPEPLRGSVVGTIARDLTSGTHPAAGVIAPVLAEAAGVPHTSARLVVMPNDPALGAFARTFANLIGTFEEYPMPAGGGNPGFMGATEIIPSTEMWKKWMEGPGNAVDRLAYLRARILDLWVDNYDRNRGQWRWMRLPGKDAWQPLSEDPDFVLVHRDGIVARAIRSEVPQYLMFSEKYPARLDGALLNSAEMDRWILAGTSAAEFETMARELQSRFTDEVIERALRQMPAEWYAKSGTGTAAALRTRRAGLVDYVLRVYRYYAHVVDIHATDRSERVSVARAADGSIEVTVGLADGAAEPYYRRRFATSETEEIRIFLHGGDDRVERTGPPGGPMTVRVVAGGGRDVVDDSKSGGTDVWRDAGTLDVNRGRDTHVRDTVWLNPIPVKDAPWIEPRSYGQWTVSAPIFGYAPDVLVYVGYGFTRTAWGFRTEPAKSVQTLQGALTTGYMTGKIEYLGTFRRPASGFGYQLHAYWSGVESYNYFGVGNNSPATTDLDRYKTREKIFSFAPTLRYDARRRVGIFVGPEIRYSTTPGDTGTIVADQAPLGVGGFGLVAVRGGLIFDSREKSSVAAKADYTKTLYGSEAAFPVNGVRLQASGFVVPKAWDVDSPYGGVDGQVTAYLGNSLAHLAIRAGGRKLWGDYPWFDAAFVGGLNNRGYQAGRFAGDSSLFGALSVRRWLGEVALKVISLRLGLVAFGDVGRVWLIGEDSKAWHSSLGGGLLVQPLGAPLTAHVIAARSTEGTMLYFGLGYPF
jgi:hypothetical protein